MQVEGLVIIQAQGFCTYRLAHTPQFRSAAQVVFLEELGMLFS